MLVWAEPASIPNCKATAMARPRRTFLLFISCLTFSSAESLRQELHPVNPPRVHLAGVGETECRSGGDDGAVQVVPVDRSPITPVLQLIRPSSFRTPSQNPRAIG